MRIRPVAALLAVLACVLTAAACTDDAAEDSTGPPAGGGSGPGFAELVGKLPEEHITLGAPLLLGDLAATRDHLGISEAPASDAALREHRAQLFAAPPAPAFFPMPQRLSDAVDAADPHAMRDATGISIEEIDRYLSVGHAASSLDIYVGRFDANAISAALGTPEDRDGGQLWAVDASGPAAPTRVSPFGYPVWIYLRGDTMVWAQDAAAIERAIATLDRPESGGAKRVVLELARALDEHHPTGAYVHLGAVEPLEGMDGAYTPPPEPLPRYEGWAVAVLPSSDATQAVLALAYADDVTAEAAAAALEANISVGTSFRTDQPWTEVLLDHDVSVDGNVTLVRFRTTGARGRDWSVLAFYRDLPIFVTD